MGSLLLPVQRCVTCSQLTLYRRRELQLMLPHCTPLTPLWKQHRQVGQAQYGRTAVHGAHNLNFDRAVGGAGQPPAVTALGQASHAGASSTGCSCS
jgi:hypothetical protein